MLGSINMMFRFPASLMVTFHLYFIQKYITKRFTLSCTKHRWPMNSLQDPTFHLLQTTLLPGITFHPHSDTRWGTLNTQNSCLILYILMQWNKQFWYLFQNLPFALFINQSEQCKGHWWCFHSFTYEASAKNTCSTKCRQKFS